MREIFSERKNQIVLGLLVAMVGMAGYLNYIDTKDDVVSIDTYESILLSDEGEIITTLGEELMLPSSETSSTTNDTSTTTETTIKDTTSTSISTDTETIVVSEEELDPVGDAIFVSTNVDDEFFVQSKLDREQARAKEKDFLVEIINNTSVAENEKKEAANRILGIQERIEKETATEAMIEAKGFKDVYVRIDDTTVDVIVSKETLTESELAQIEDIVQRKTGLEPENIRISTFKVSQ
ncbi:MAG: SpoIIIAH-like family protein [Lachnospirales bacterium]